MRRSSSKISADDERYASRRWCSARSSSSSVRSNSSKMMRMKYANMGAPVASVLAQPCAERAISQKSLSGGLARYPDAAGGGESVRIEPTFARQQFAFTCFHADNGFAEAAVFDGTP